MAEGETGQTGVVYTDSCQITKSDFCKQINQYRVVKKLAKGSFSTVKLCERRLQGDDDLAAQMLERLTISSSSSCVVTGGIPPIAPSAVESFEVAVKIFDRAGLSRKREFRTVDGSMKVTTAWDKVANELQILSKLHHPNIVQALEIIDDLDCRKLYLVTEYLGGGQLLNHDPKTLRFFNPKTDAPWQADKALAYARDVATGLSYLHNLGVIHRDIKPENLLLTEDGARCVIVDFGVAYQLSGDRIEDGIVRGTQGTYAFLAPEVCKGGPYNGYRADTWALGVTLHTAVFGKLPFWVCGMKPLLDLIKATPYELPPEAASLRVTSGGEAVCEVLEGLLSTADERWDAKRLLSDRLL